MLKILRKFRGFFFITSFSLKRMAALVLIFVSALGCSKANNSNQVSANSTKANLVRSAPTAPPSLPPANPSKIEAQKNSPFLTVQTHIPQTEVTFLPQPDSVIGPSPKTDALLLDQRYVKNPGTGEPLSLFNVGPVTQDTSGAGSNAAVGNLPGNFSALPFFSAGNQTGLQGNPTSLSTGLINPATSALKIASLGPSPENSGSTSSSNTVPPLTLLNLPPQSQGPSSPPSLPILNLGNTLGGNSSQTSSGSSTSSGGTNTGTSTSVNPAIAALVSGSGNSGSGGNSTGGSKTAASTLTSGTPGAGTTSGGGSTEGSSGASTTGGSTAMGGGSGSGGSQKIQATSSSLQGDTTLASSTPPAMPTDAGHGENTTLDVSSSGQVSLNASGECNLTNALKVTFKFEGILVRGGQKTTTEREVPVDECGKFSEGVGEYWNCNYGQASMKYQATYSYYNKQHGTKFTCAGESDLPSCEDIHNYPDLPSKRAVEAKEVTVTIPLICHQALFDSRS